MTRLDEADSGAGLWQPGDYITGRNIWHGRVFTAWVFVVVEDRGDVIAAFTPPGTVWKSPTDLEGNDIRLPHGEWLLRDNIWHGRGMVRVFLKGVAHSVLVFLGDGDVRWWYVNLEAPFQRTAIGLDTTDLHLDVVFPPDLSVPQWKDEHEVEEAVAFGSMTREDAEAARVEAERAIKWIQSGDHPAIDDRWRTWTPPPEWGIPTLAPGWETLPTEVV